MISILLAICFFVSGCIFECDQNVDYYSQKTNQIPITIKEKAEVSSREMFSYFKAKTAKAYFELEEKNSSEIFGLPDYFKKLKRNSGTPKPEVEATSAGVIYLDEGNFLYEKNSREQIPIASITKLMTALVFLDNNPGWDEIYKIKRSDRREGGRIYLYLGDEVKVKDLFYSSLVGSANTATVAMVSSTGLSKEEFLSQMNIKAHKLGLFHTHFKDLTGLDSGNVSTARDVSLLALEAFSHSEIRKAVANENYIFETEQGVKKEIESTDALLSDPESEIVGGKTGYTESAGYCFVGLFRRDNREVISVVLGTENINDRFEQAEKLADWTFRAYQW